MNNPSIEVLLCKWGRWAIRCESGALGFASSSILVTSGDGDGFGEGESKIPHGVIGDSDLEAIDCAVKRLKPILRMSIIQVYQFGYGKSADGNAKTLGISRRTLTQYLNLAKMQISIDIAIQSNENM